MTNGIPAISHWVMAGLFASASMYEQLPIDLLIDTVATTFNVSIEQMKARIRKPAAVDARYMVMWLLRHRKHYNFEQIAEELTPYISKYHHSTVMHGVEAMGDRLITEFEMAEKLKEVEKNLLAVTIREYTIKK